MTGDVGMAEPQPNTATEEARGKGGGASAGHAEPRSFDQPKTSAKAGDGGALVVCGHKAEENGDASSTYRVSERRYGRFERAFPLPADVDRDRIEAQFRDGVLRITLPKSPTAAPQKSRIEIG